MTDAAQPSGDAGPRRVGALRATLAMMISPGRVLEQHAGSIAAPWALLVSGLAFTLFFLQTGLDLERVGRLASDDVAALAGKGAAIGILGVAVLAFLAWAFSLPFGGQRTAGWAVRAFGLGYSPALVYGAVGLGLNLGLKWNTAVACGVTGLLWALGPLFAALREMTGGKNGVSAVLSTLCGAAMLFAWAELSLGGG